MYHSVSLSEDLLHADIKLSLSFFLQVCGINMRNATYQLAANVLRQCGNSVTMLVQYNPESK